MKRLFVAIDFPDAVKNDLHTLKTAIPTARWVSSEQMHLTLFFIGETEHESAIKAVLAEISFSPFALTLSGVGRFPLDERKPPRVVWVGLQPSPVLMQLQQDVSQALLKVGFPAPDQHFSPHVTLARLKTERPLTELTHFLDQHQNFRSESMMVTQFVLMSSVLTPAGSHYTYLESIKASQ